MVHVSRYTVWLDLYMWGLRTILEIADSLLIRFGIVKAGLGNSLISQPEELHMLLAFLPDRT